MVVVDGPDDCNQRLENPHLEPLVVSEAEDGVQLAGALLLRQAACPLRRHHRVSLEPVLPAANRLLTHHSDPFPGGRATLWAAVDCTSETGEGTDRHVLSH